MDRLATVTPICPHDYAGNPTQDFSALPILSILTHNFQFWHFHHHHSPPKCVKLAFSFLLTIGPMSLIKKILGKLQPTTALPGSDVNTRLFSITIWPLERSSWRWRSHFCGNVKHSSYWNLHTNMNQMQVSFNCYEKLITPQMLTLWMDRQREW